MRIRNEAILNHIFEHDVILVPMSINSSMNKGFRHDIAVNFPQVKAEELTTNYGDRRKYGTIYPIECECMVFCMCYMYKTKYNTSVGNDTVDYEALCSCLELVKKKYGNYNIATPILGESKFDGNGNKAKILSIIEDKLSDCNVTVYDYNQVDNKHECFKEIAALHKRLRDKEINGEEYIKERSKIEWRRRYGIFKPIPEDYKYIPRKGEVRK